MVLFAIMIFCTQGYFINCPERLFVIRYLKWVPNFVHWLIKCCKLILSYLDFLDYCFFSKIVFFFYIGFLGSWLLWLQQNISKKNTFYTSQNSVLMIPF